MQIKQFITITKGCWGLQGGLKELQGVTGCYKGLEGFQCVTRDYRGLHRG